MRQTTAPAAQQPPGSSAATRLQARQLGARLADDDHRTHRYTLTADRSYAASVGLRMNTREVKSFNNGYRVRWDELRIAYERRTKKNFEWTDNPSSATSA